MMKKVMVLLSAVLLVSGFMVTAAMAIQPGGGQNKCVTCEGYTPTEDLQINRGCEGTQTTCAPFDYEGQNDGPNSYCSKSVDHRAIFNICECIPPDELEIWDDILVGETINIQLEIMVGPAITRPEDTLNWSESLLSTYDTQGVYWAEDINPNGIPMETHTGTDQDAACASGAYSEIIAGQYAYLTANGTSIQPATGSSCNVPTTNRAVKITPIFPSETNMVPDPGYTVTTADNGMTAWAIDIPEMRVDPSLVQRNQGVYVKITLFKSDDAALNDDSICTDPSIIGCPCIIYIGRLCCEADDSLVYPYFPPANSSYWGLIGLTVTNVSDADGVAKITVYETDGDVGVIDGIDTGDGSGVLKAKETYLNNLSSLLANENMEQIAGAGSLGDSRCYIEITAGFDVTGFAMIANPSTGESMGYLPIPSSATEIQ